MIALLAYFIWEPFRGADAPRGLQGPRRSSAARCCSPTPTSEEYDSTKSLLCADCHGVDGGGGSAHFVVKSEDPRCDPDQVVDAELAEEQPVLPARSRWRGRRRASSSRRCGTTAEQLTQIITYGRPGTPMPAWGVLSGKGALRSRASRTS